MIFILRRKKWWKMTFEMNENNIPDFEDMVKVAESIRELSLERTRLELTIEDSFSKTVLQLTTNPEYFVNNKPPSMVFIKSTYGFSGLDGKLYEYRVQLGTVEAELDYLKNKLNIYRDMIDVWRTVSANKRASVI